MRAIRKRCSQGTAIHGTRGVRQSPLFRLFEAAVDNGFVDIVQGGFDAGIRLVESLERDMSAVRVSRNRRASVVASPGYCAAHPQPRTPRELRDHRHRTAYGVGRDLHRWEFARQAVGLRVAVEGPLVLDSDDLILRAAVDGVGVAMLEESTVAVDIAAGRLRRMLESWCPPMAVFFLYHPAVRDTPARLQALIEIAPRDINAAFARLEAGDVRYRFVIDMAA